MTQDADRPFYRLGSWIDPGAIPRDAFLDFLVRTFEAGGIEMEGGTAAQILEVAEEVPYNVQRVSPTRSGNVSIGEASAREHLTRA